MSKIIKEELDNLSELIRQAYDLIHSEEDIDHVFKKDIKQRLYGKHPKCFLKLMPIGQDIEPYLLPICNRAGIGDKRVIKASCMIVQKLMSQENPMFDINSLQGVLNQLQHKETTLSQRIPKPSDMAARKGHVSRMFNNIKSYLDLIKTGDV